MTFARSVHRFAAPMRLASLAAALCSAPAAWSQSVLPPGVGIYLEQTIVGIGEASYASSGTVSIYSGGGLSTSSNSQFTYGLTSPTTMPLGLTTATLSSIGSNIPYGHATGEASATADLSGGVLRSTTASFADVPFQQVGPVSARVETTAVMQDFVTFAVASSEGADVTVSAHLDGNYALSDPYYSNGSADMTVVFGGSFTYYAGLNAAGDITAYHGAVLGDYSSYTFSNETPTGFDFTGVLHVTDQERIRVAAGLYLDCSFSSCGFGNTARIGLDVPTGVSYTSDSGVFLAGANAVAPIPEPETWAMLLAGFAVLGGMARRRAKAVGGSAPGGSMA